MTVFGWRDLPPSRPRPPPTSARSTPPPSTVSPTRARRGPTRLPAAGQHRLHRVQPQPGLQGRSTARVGLDDSSPASRHGNDRAVHGRHAALLRLLRADPVDRGGLRRHPGFPDHHRDRPPTAAGGHRHPAGALQLLTSQWGGARGSGVRNRYAGVARSNLGLVAGPDFDTEIKQLQATMQHHRAGARPRRDARARSPTSASRWPPPTCGTTRPTPPGSPAGSPPCRARSTGSPTLQRPHRRPRAHGRARPARRATRDASPRPRPSCARSTRPSRRSRSAPCSPASTTPARRWSRSAPAPAASTPPTSPRC